MRFWQRMACAVALLVVPLPLVDRSGREQGEQHAGGPPSQQPDDARVGQALLDYRAGRHEAALAVFVDELAVRGDDAPAELRLDAALAALRLLRSRDAEQLLLPLSENEPFAAEVSFLLGIAASQQAERAVVAAGLENAEPMAWPIAVRSILRAEAQFQQAAELRSPWPEALRNAERAMRRRLEIEQQRDAAQNPDAKQEQVLEPSPEPPPLPQGGEPEAVAAEVVTQQLSADELRQLQQRVRDQQQQKVRGRQQSVQRAATAGERSW